jgi:tetratricopeptide (TPR) repeat protein
LKQLGTSLHLRYKRYGDIEDLQDSISVWVRAAKLVCNDGSDTTYVLSYLGNLFYERFSRVGNIEDLEQAVLKLTHANELTPDGHPNKPGRLTNFGNVLHKRFQQLGSMDDLEQAIVSHTRAVDLTPDGHPDKPARLNNLGNILHERFQRLGGMDDLEQAVTMLTRATELTPDEHPDKLGRLNNLGNVFHTRFQRFGNMDDLEQAVEVKTRAVTLTPDNHPDKSAFLNNLGNVLHERFQRLGGTDDLEQAMAMLTRAAEFTLDEHPDKPRQLNNLGNVFHARFRRLGNVGDLEQAMTAKTRAVKLTPDNHPDKSMFLNNFGNILHERFEEFGDMHDLEHAVTILIEANELTPATHPDKPERLTNLSNVLFNRYELAKDAESLSYSIDCADEAVKLASNQYHAQRTALLLNLASKLYARFRSFYVQPADLTRAITTSTKATTQNFGRPSDRLKAAILHTTLLSHVSNSVSHGALIEAHEKALDLIPQIVWLGNSVQKRYKELIDHGLGAFAHRAAADAIAVGEYTRAVEWLDSRRSVVWSQRVNLWTSLDELRLQEPGLASKLEQLSHSLEDKISTPISAPTGNRLHNAKSLLTTNEKSYYGLAIEYDRTIELVRSIQGFESFLRPTPFSKLVTACATGPVVIINVHDSRCDALVLHHPGDILHVPLSRFSYDDAIRLHKQFSDVIRNNAFLNVSQGDVQRDDEDEINPIQPASKWNAIILQILAELWEFVAKPIISSMTGIVSISRTLDL